MFTFPLAIKAFQWQGTHLAEETTYSVSCALQKTLSCGGHFLTTSIVNVNVYATSSNFKNFHYIPFITKWVPFKIGSTSFFLKQNLISSTLT